jgi:hypothetical protein
MRCPISSVRLLGLAAIALTTLLASCSSARPAPIVPAHSLPAYAGHEAALFDDGIEPQAVGYSLEPAVSPREDRLLRERTRLGDRVVKAQVVSLTSTRNESGRIWQIGLRTIEELAGVRAGAQEFTLRMNGTAPGSSVMGVFDSRLIGVPLVAFMREFEPTGGGGKSELHFHLAGQDKDEIDAVRVAALSGEAR